VLLFVYRIKQSLYIAITRRLNVAKREFYTEVFIFWGTELAKFEKLNLLYARMSVRHVIKIFYTLRVIVNSLYNHVP